MSVPRQGLMLSLQLRPIAYVVFWCKREFVCGIMRSSRFFSLFDLPPNVLEE
jgi:hypothetical protein